MIISQIMLTGFVVQWLFSQYGNAKAKLNEELIDIYMESHNELVDTLLYRNIIRPALSDTTILNRDVKSGAAFRKIRPLIISKEIKKDTLAREKTGKATITVRLNGQADTRRHQSLIQSKINKQDVILKGVKLFIGSSLDSSGTINSLIDSLPYHLDTALFKTCYVQNLPADKKKLNISWELRNQTDSDGSRKNVILIKPITGGDMPEARIGGFNGYLLSKILPQVLFGIVLVLITALAFVIAYRGIINQILLNEQREEFINNMTHELKTPVSTVKIALESLLSLGFNKDPAITGEYLNLASVETKRLENLINRILDQTLIEGNNHPFSPERINATRLIEEAVKAMTPRLEKDGFIRFLPEEEEILLTGDKLYLQGVLQNLLDNSIKYCNTVPEIIISIKKTLKHIEVTITDNGPGIPSKYQKKIFEKFFRIPTGDIHNIKGYGLGLSYASLVMRIHGGNINVINHDQGCSFILRFPAT